MTKILILMSVALVLLAQGPGRGPINIGPNPTPQAQMSNTLSGMPKPSASVVPLPETTLSIAIPGVFATAVEKDRVDTLIPVLGQDGKTITLVPLNATLAAHLRWLLMQDGGALVTTLRKYPPAAVQSTVDAANNAAQSLQKIINDARKQ